MARATNLPVPGPSWAFVAWLVVVCAALWWPDLEAPGGLPIPRGFDLAVHLLLFVPGGLLLEGIPGRGALSRRWLLLEAVLFGSALGLLTEGVQALVPGRHPSILDGLADVLGFAAGWWLARAKHTASGPEPSPGASDSLEESRPDLW